MTDLLDPPRPPSVPTAGPRRSLALGAALAGVGSAAVVLAGCLGLALLGWFASDAGSHGDTLDAIRVGTVGWLLAEGAPLELATGAGPATVSALPLGLTLLACYVAHRMGRRAAATSAVDDVRTVALGAVVLAGLHAVVALAAAVLASTPAAELGLVRAFGGGFLLALLAGGTGLLRGSGPLLDWPTRLPEAARAVGLGAVAMTLLMAAAGSVLVAVALLLDLGTAANVLSRLHVDLPAAVLSTLLVAALAPNAVLLAVAYLLGPGFALGAGTVVSPGLVELGPVPALPLLAALPPAGTPPPWLSALAAAPVLAAVLGVALMLRRHPVLGYRAGAGRGVGAGLAGGLLTTAAVALAGGSVGPGRMADVGAPLLDTLLAASVAMGVAGLFTGIGVTWWARRR